MRPTQFLSSVLLFSALSAASAPWSESWHIKAVRDIEDVIFARADTSASSTAAASTAAASTAAASSESSATSKTTAKSASGTTDAASASGSSASGSGTSASGSGTSASGTSKTTDKSSTTKKSSSTKTYGNSVGYGGVSMITPNVYSSSSYYKVGNYVTFAWNFTSLSVTPTAVDILASCSANDATYTLAMNQSVSDSTMAVTWDTGDYQATATVPLLTETYTLMIYDAALSDVTASVQYGHLSAYTAHTFGMYTPQPYSNTSGNDTEIFTCVTCKRSAASSLERQTLGALLGMVALTVASFTWFANGAGLL